MKRLIHDLDGFNDLVKARHGYLLYNRNDWYVGRSIERYGEYSELEARLLCGFCRHGSVVVEAGANIGALTLPLARRVGPAGRVLAFEPQRIVFQTLCANLALNSLVNVDARDVALGATRATLHAPSMDYTRPNNFGDYGLRADRKGPPVSVVALDQVMDTPRLDLIKIDVQGMEADVIAGARGQIQRHRPVLYVENDRADRSPALVELLAGLGYRLYWHCPPLFNPDNFAGETQNVFGDTCSFNMLGVHTAVNLVVEGLPEVRRDEPHPMVDAANQ